MTRWWMRGTAWWLDRSREMMTATLVPTGMAADWLEKLEDMFREESCYYVPYRPLSLWVGKRDDERHPVTEEGFMSVGHTLQQEEMYVKEGRLYLMEQGTEITNPLGYYMVAGAGQTLRTVRCGLTWLANLAGYTAELLWSASES